MNFTMKPCESRVRPTGSIFVEPVIIKQCDMQTSSIMPVFSSIQDPVMVIPVDTDNTSCSVDKQMNIGAGSTLSGDMPTSNEKETMQNLNVRLAAYLVKVQSLRKANDQLEYQIKEWYQNRTPDLLDTSKYWDTIANLSSKLKDTFVDNASIQLQIENAKLALDDFRNKYESEVQQQQEVETETTQLKKIMDQLTLTKSELEQRYEELKEEKINLKKDHEKEFQALRAKLNKDVCVEVDAAPSVDLTVMMEKMRKQYTDMTEKYREESEAWFNQKVAAFNKEINFSSGTLQAQTTQFSEMRRTVQSLEVEIESLHKMKIMLQSTLSETETRYWTQLQQIQNVISRLEEELTHIRMNAAQQACDYTALTQLRSKLEHEISTYHKLLSREEGRPYHECGLKPEE